MEIIKRSLLLRIMELTAYLLLIASVLTTFLIHDGCCLKRVEMIMPKFVRRGGEVKLTCKYDVDVGSLYAVKWYRLSSEFFRFVPREVPKFRAFPQPGIVVDLSKSNEHNVVLRNVPLEASGQFKCVVSAETTFQTLYATSQLTVVVIGDDRPFVELERAQYHPGDSVVAHCFTQPSHPPTNVTWYLDNVTLGDRLMKTEIQAKDDDPVVKATVSTISFNLPVQLPSEPFRLRCRASVFEAYDQNYTIHIQPVPRQLSDPHTLLRSDSSSEMFGSSYFLKQTIKVTCAQHIIFFVVQLLLLLPVCWFS